MASTVTVSSSGIGQRSLGASSRTNSAASSASLRLSANTGAPPGAASSSPVTPRAVASRPASRACHAARAILARAVAEEVPEDQLACRDVAPLVIDDPSEDPSGRRLVHLVGEVEVALVGAEQVRLQHPVHADQPLHRLAWCLRLLHDVHERHEGGIRGLRDLGLRAQLGQPLAECVGVLGVVPHVTAHEELRGQLGREGEPAAEDPHHALGGVAIVADHPRRLVDREMSVERIHSVVAEAWVAKGFRGHRVGQYTCDRWVVLIRRWISSSVKPPS